MERAQASGAEALVLTIDNQILGQRERDLVNGFTIPPRVTARNAADMALSLPWLLTLGRGPGITFANYRGSAPSDDIRSLGAYIAQILDPGITWDDVAWVRGLWKGPLVVKGILHPEDAREAIAQGADGIVVSNHGGRQLDKAISSIRALPRVAEAVAGSAPLLIDGGVRRGTDILKAVALGATACLVGRPHLWGLAVAGEAGVAHVLDIFRRELDRAMALGGWRTLADIDGTALGASEPAARREGEAALRLAG
jgi:L-lactate dehydrogenase (cytochrome)/(S)-mandelate dehydrogenase